MLGIRQGAFRSYGEAPASEEFATDFAERILTAGVFRYFDFHDDTELGDITGNFNSGIPIDVSILYGSTSPYSGPVIDHSNHSLGALRFDVPTNSESDPCGAWLANPSSDFLTQFTEGDTFTIQWRQRWNQAFIDTLFQLENGSVQGGIKLVDISTADAPGSRATSCTSLELVVQTYYQNRFPIMYQSCGACDSHGAYNLIDTPVAPSDFILQTANASCLYSENDGQTVSVSAGCEALYADEWMTFEVQVTIGTFDVNQYENSNIKMWMARENALPVLVQDKTYDICCGTTPQNFFKLWLLPYMTNKWAGQAHSLCQTWYSEVIFSTAYIPFPYEDGPAEGTFSEFTTNTPADAYPYFNETMLATWNGTALVDDFGTDGAEVTEGGGHTQNPYEYGGVLVLDRGTRTFMARCIPALAPQHRTNDAFNGYGCFAANGAPTREHTYNSLQQMPTAWGGGSQGSMVRIGMTGGLNNIERGKNCTIRFDLSQTVDGHHNLTNEYSAGSFPYDYGDGQAAGGITDTIGSAIDWNREGWWTKSSLYTSYGDRFLFTSKTGQVTPLLVPTGTAERNWLHHFADDDLIVWGTSYGVDAQIRVFVPNGTDSFTYVTTSGPAPGTIDGSQSAMAYLGMKWSTILNCFVGINLMDWRVNSTTLRVTKLTPPAPGSRRTGTWVWSTEDVVASDAAVLAATDEGIANGCFGRVHEWLTYRCFTFTNAWNKKALWFRLTGML